MECCLKFNSLILVGAFCVCVTTLGSETRDRRNEDPLSIPLINDKGAPLVAMLDTNAINTKMKVYIRALMRDMIQSSIREEMQGIFKTALEENSTIDFIRNITLQEISEVLKEQGHEGVRNERASSKNDMRIDKIMQELQDVCILDDTHQTVEKMKRNTQIVLDNIEVYKDMVKLNTKLRKELEWIMQESKGERESRRIFELLKRDTKGICLPKYIDCTELKRKTKKKLNDGVYKIYPGGDNPVQAYCDMTTDGGGWTVMLKRFGGSVSFKRTWVECENGFGDLDGDFWFGNKYTHMLTSGGKYELRVDMVDLKTNRKTYAVYKTFIIGDAASKYKLTVGDYSGNAGDRLRHHNNKKFTTIDQDNDNYGGNCAVQQGGSWWYTACSDSDLSRTIYKPYWTNSVSKSVMMIRKI